MSQDDNSNVLVDLVLGIIKAWLYFLFLLWFGLTLAFVRLEKEDVNYRAFSKDGFIKKLQFTFMLFPFFILCIFLFTKTKTHIFYAIQTLQYLTLSLALSYLISWLISKEKIEKNEGILAVSSSYALWFYYQCTRLSYPFIWLFYFFRPRGPAEISDVMQLGHEPTAFLTDKNLNYHTQIIGGSGSGKTNLLKVMIEDRVAKGHSVIFFDFKADIELMDWMAGLTSHYSREDDLVMISMSDSEMSYAYNPIARGTETEISSQIMNAFTWSESFYRNTAENGLLVTMKAFCWIRDIEGWNFNLGHLYKFLTDSSFRMDIVAAVSSLNYPDIYRADLKRICEELSTKKVENYHGLISQISKILNSSAGEIVSEKLGNDFEFDLKEAMSSGQIAYLFMNSLKLKDTAAIMGKLMLQDLMKVVGNIYDDRDYVKKPTTLIIDEFASFATPDFGEFIEKARGAGISVVVAYQSRKSLDHIEQNLSLKINENTANKIVFQVQDSEDVEWFTSLLGTKTVIKETNQAEDGFFGPTKTGAKSLREVEEYIVHPNQIKGLSFGQALLYCSKIDPHFGIMNIFKANEYQGRYVKKKLEKISEIQPEKSNDFYPPGASEDLLINDLI